MISFFEDPRWRMMKVSTKGFVLSGSLHSLSDGVGAVKVKRKESWNFL
jgi:hypothetical protein